MAVGLIEIRIPQLRDLRGRFASMADRELVQMRKDQMRRLSQRMLDQLRFEAPRRTGALQGSFKSRVRDVGGAIVARFTSSVSYATIVAFGTRKRGYRIGRPGQVMRMEKLELIGPFAARQKSVRFRTGPFRHPGVRADNYVRRAVLRLRPEWDSAWQRMGRAVVIKLARRGMPI